MDYGKDQDPYAFFKFNGTTYQTKIKKDAGLNVTWTHEDNNLFMLKPKPNSILELYAYDWDKMKYDDLIGKADPINLSELLTTTDKQHLDIFQHSIIKGKKKTGYLVVSLRMFNGN